MATHEKGRVFIEYMWIAAIAPLWRDSLAMTSGVIRYGAVCFNGSLQRQNKGLRKKCTQGLDLSVTCAVSL